MKVAQAKALGWIAVGVLFWYLYTHPARAEVRIETNVLNPNFGLPVDANGNPVA